MTKQKQIMIIAGEPSGDMHGANLIKELKKKDSSCVITGIGGELMKQEGMEILFHIKELSAMGVTEVLKQFKQIKKAFDIFKSNINNFNKNNLLILIDYPGFNLKAAAYAKKRGVPVLYYITPKVWAWNRSRLKKIKKYVDHAALIFPFEESIFRKENIPCTFVGNPLLDCYEEYKRKKEFSKSTLSKSNNSNLPPLTIGLLPGSRESEISNLLEIMIKSAIIISNGVKSKAVKNLNNIRFFLSAASSININKFNKILEPYNLNNIKSYDKLNADQLEKDNGIFEIIKGSPVEIFERCDLIIAASGTVTLEAAIFNVPMIIIYKTSPITYFLAKNFIKIPYIGLPNIAANYSVVPELIQDNATPEKIADKALLMINENNLAVIKKRLSMIPKYLGGSGASEKTARIAMKIIKN